MRNWQSLGGLFFLGSAVACATATNSGGPMGDPGGTDSSGATGGDIVSPAGGNGTITGGAPATAGGTSSTSGGTSSNAFGGTGAAPSAGSGSGGAVGASGAAGAHSGGSSGTSSGGAATAGSGGAATAGTGGATNTGPCANPVDVSKGTSNMLGTLGPVCMRTAETFNTLACFNFDGRTMTVNGMAFTCTANPVGRGTFAPAIDGFNYFDVSAGSKDYAAFSWYTQ